MMGLYKTLSRASGLALGAVLLAGAAAADGTPAGSTVENTFTLTYQVGTVTQPPVTNSASPTAFTVDRKVDLTLTALTPTVTAAPNSTDNIVRYRLTNLGNDNQAYDLSEVNTGSTYTPTNEEIFYWIDTTPNGVLDPGETRLPYTLGTPTVDIAPDAQVIIEIESDVAAGTANGLTAPFILTADTLYAGTSVDPNCASAVLPAIACTAGDEVLADTGGNTDLGISESVLLDGAGDTDAVNEGNFSATATITIEAPVLNANKTVTVLDTDPANNAACTALTTPAAGDQYPVPGACVLYTITIANTGTVAADNVSIQDRLPEEVDFLQATQTGFTDGSIVAGTGPVLADPGAFEDCDGTTNCLVDLSDAAVNGGVSGVIRIWALVE